MAEQSLHNTTHPPGSYQQTLRDEEGWNDLTTRVRALRERAEVCRRTHERVQAVKSAFATSQQAGQAALTAALKADPANAHLLQICLEQASTLIREQNSATARAVIKIGLDYGQDKLVVTLRQLDIVAQIVDADARKDHREMALLAEQLANTDLPASMVQLVRNRLENLYQAALVQSRGANPNTATKLQKAVEKLRSVLSDLFPDWNPDARESERRDAPEVVPVQHQVPPLVQSSTFLLLVAVLLVAVGLGSGMFIMAAVSHQIEEQPAVGSSAVVSPTVDVQPASTPTVIASSPVLSPPNLTLVDINQSVQSGWTYDFPRSYYALFLDVLPDEQRPQGRFVVVLMHVTNQTGQDQPLPPGFFQLVDSQNRLYASRPDIQQLLPRTGSPYVIDLTELDPIPADGNYRRVQLIFEVAADANELKIFAPDGPAVGWPLTPLDPQQIGVAPFDSDTLSDSVDGWHYTFVPQETRVEPEFVAVQMFVANHTGQTQSIPPLLLVLKDAQGHVYLPQPGALASSAPSTANQMEYVPANEIPQPIWLVFKVLPDANEFMLFTPARPEQGWPISRQS